MKEPPSAVKICGEKQWKGMVMEFPGPFPDAFTAAHQQEIDTKVLSGLLSLLIKSVLTPGKNEPTITALKCVKETALSFHLPRSTSCMCKRNRVI